MLTISIFTFKRPDSLQKCLNSIDLSFINEIFIFNDNEKQTLSLDQLYLDNTLNKRVKIFNPIDWGFNERKFRKPIYMNKAIDMAKNKYVLFSDDDGEFKKGAIEAHYNALQNHVFTAGGIIRNKFFNKISKSILQGTNYAFHKNFFTSIGGYDERFVDSMGGGDVDFWYRIYNYVKKYNVPIAFLSNAIQIVRSKSSREKKSRTLDPKEFTLQKHGLDLNGPMYKWFPEIRDKSKWMNYINE